MFVFVGVYVGVIVNVGVIVGVGVSVIVGVTVDVDVNVGVNVGVDVDVGVGDTGQQLFPKTMFVIVTPGVNTSIVLPSKELTGIEQLPTRFISPLVVDVVLDSP